MNKIVNTNQILSQITDGMTIGIGGWGARRKPMSIIRAICKSDLKDLTIVTYGGPDVGLLCSAKKVKKLIFGFVSLDIIPLDSHFRKARQAGEIKELMEIDEGMLQWGLRAAAMRLPFLPTRVGFGTDVLGKNKEIKLVKSPYDDGEELIAMPAINLDVSLLHVNTADEKGNTLIYGPDPFFDDLFARAAKQTFVSAEQIIKTSEFKKAEVAVYNHFERNLVHGVFHSEGGAHPTSCDPNYGIDIAHLKEYSQASDSFDDYYKKFINISDNEYLDVVGGMSHVNSISKTIF